MMGKISSNQYHKEYREKHRDALKHLVIRRKMKYNKLLLNKHLVLKAIKTHLVFLNYIM